MLKKRKTSLKSFLQSQRRTKLHNTWKKARKGEKMLQKKHQLEEKAEQKATEDALELEAAAKAKRAAAALSKEHNLKKTKAAATGKSTTKAAKKAVAVAKRRLQGTSSASQSHCPPPVSTPKIGDWMAVVYENGWFPGHVLRADEETETYYTNFLHPRFHCRTVQTPSASRPGRCEEDLHLCSADPTANVYFWRTHPHSTRQHHPCSTIQLVQKKVFMSWQKSWDKLLRTVETKMKKKRKRREKLLFKKN